MAQLPKDEFDGLYFLPGEEDGELEIHYFHLKDEYANSTPIGTDLYHIAFFDRDDEGQPKFDAAFEAVLGDPSVYITNLVGAETYGCVLRKTDKSGKWFEEYLKKALQKITIRRMKNALESIANN